MDPPQINFIDRKSILVINHSGRMRQLFAPFKVQVLQPTSVLVLGTWVLVDEILPHNQYKIIYRIGDQWWPYNIFRLEVLF